MLNRFSNVIFSKALTHSILLSSTATVKWFSEDDMIQNEIFLYMTMSFTNTWNVEILNGYNLSKNITIK